MHIAGIMKVTLLDYPEHVACTVFTGGCNFRCPFCYNSGLVLRSSPAVMDDDEFFEFLSKRRGRLEGVAISGGEPTLEPDLKPFIRRIKYESGMTVKLDTNGTHPEVVRELIEQGLVDYVAMDIKSGPTGYSRAAGIDIDRHLMDDIAATKDLLIRGPIEYEFRTTAVGGLHKESDFREIGDFIDGAARYFIQCYTPEGDILSKDGGLYSPTPEDLAGYLDIVRPHVGCAELRGVG